MTILTLQPASDDSDIYVMYYTNANIDTEDKICAGHWADPLNYVRLLLKFNSFATIPGITSVVSSNLYLTGSGTNSGSTTISFYRLLRDWVKSQAAWTIWKTANSWATAGGMGAGDSDTGTVFGSLAMTGTALGTVYTIPMSNTETLKWLNGTNPYYGWLARLGNEGGDFWYTFCSTRHATASYHPKWIIDYVGAGGMKQQLVVTL